MNLNKRFKKLASLITCGAICAVMLFGGTSPAFSHALAESTPGESKPSVTAEPSAEPDFHSPELSNNWVAYTDSILTPSISIQ